MDVTQLELNWILIFIPLLGLTSQWLAWYFRLPAIVLLTAMGLIFGPGLGILKPEAQFGELLSPLIRVCVALILFDGGLNLRFYEYREAASGVRRLVFPAVPIAWALYSIATHYIGGINWPLALIFGAIIVVSGPTVVIPLLRQANLKRRPASYIKWEGIINDPIGALLAIFIFQYFILSAAGQSWQHIVASMVLGAGTALILGGGGSYFIASAFRRGYVPEYLKIPVVFGAVLIVFALSSSVQDGAGLLATTLFGLVFGNLNLPSIEDIRRFNETTGILLVSSVFILLTANIDLAILFNLNWQYFLLLLMIIVVIRPMIVFISMLGSKVEFAERVLLACAAPRGVVAAAVGGVFAYDLTLRHFPQANMLLPMVFVLIVTSVVVYGFSLPFIGKKLKLAAEQKNGLLIIGASPWSIELAEVLVNHHIKVIIADASWQRLQAARMKNIPYFYGQILSERAEERIEFSEIGYILAASHNDAFNVLVCSHFTHKLERKNIVHLPVLENNEEDIRGGLDSALTGLSLFTQNYVYDDLIKLHYQGYHFRSRHFTGKFTQSDAEKIASQEEIPVFILRVNGEFSFFTQKNTPKVEIGDILVLYGK